ncbi:hypothetical protein QI274_01020 [Staphylococcus saprophyticus]|nr:hypothetical protein [Staphylococcus saprophyticus]
MNNTVKDYEKLSEQYNKMIAERNSLIGDVIWYKAKVSRLEDESSKYIDLLEEFSQHIGNKPSSSTYKYFRAKLDNLNITEDEQND